MNLLSGWKKNSLYTVILKGFYGKKICHILGVFLNSDTTDLYYNKPYTTWGLILLAISYFFTIVLF